MSFFGVFGSAGLSQVFREVYSSLPSADWSSGSGIVMGPASGTLVGTAPDTLGPDGSSGMVGEAASGGGFQIDFLLDDLFPGRSGRDRLVILLKYQNIVLPASKRAGLLLKNAAGSYSSEIWNENFGGTEGLYIRSSIDSVDQGIYRIGTGLDSWIGLSREGNSGFVFGESSEPNPSTVSPKSFFSFVPPTQGAGDPMGSGDYLRLSWTNDSDATLVEAQGWRSPGEAL